MSPDHTTSLPVSDHVKTRRTVYSACMVDKIRLHAAEQLPAPYTDLTSFDSLFRKIDYEQVKAHVLQGGTTEKIFDALFAGCQPLNVEQFFAWNLFLLKCGWRNSSKAGVIAESRVRRRRSHRCADLFRHPRHRRSVSTVGYPWVIENLPRKTWRARRKK